MFEFIKVPEEIRVQKDNEAVFHHLFHKVIQVHLVPKDFLEMMVERERTVRIMLEIKEREGNEVQDYVQNVYRY